MIRTGKQIEDDLWNMLRDSLLGHSINGDVYKEGFRPRNSQKEDAVVIFTAGVPNEIQTGVVTINIFVPDKDAYDTGQLLEDGKRTAILERKAQEWVDGLTCDCSNYKFKLRDTITTEPEPEIHQHFVVISLGYEYYGDDTDDLPVLETEEEDLLNVVPNQLKRPQDHLVELE